MASTWNNVSRAALAAGRAAAASSVRYNHLISSRVRTELKLLKCE